MFLLNQNFYLKKKVSDFSHLEHLLSQTQQQLSHLNYLKSFEGKSLPPSPRELLNVKTKISYNQKKSRYAILFYFLQSDCANCLIGEIATWNRFNKLCEYKNCQVIGMTDTTGYNNLKSIAKSLNIRFPLKQIPDMKSQLNEQGITIIPISFFVDLLTNKIIYANASLPYNEFSSEAFEQKLRMMLDECE
ncbi:MAG: hypothetical protein SCK70_04195 [bacterium]|nr:hypothetical protein [bacterium]